MASWCFICDRKVDASYYWYKDKKAHRSCLKKYKEQLKKEKEKENERSN